MSDEISNKPVSDRPLGKRIISGASWSVLSKALTNPAGLLLTMLLARLLSPEAMGGYFLATSLIAFALSFVQLGMGWTSVKLIAKSLAESNHKAVRQIVQVVITSVLMSSVTVALFVWLFGDLVLQLLEGGAYLQSSLVWIALLIISMAMVELIAEILRGFHDLRAASLLIDQLSQRLILVSVLGVFWWSGMQLALDESLKYSFFSAFAVVILGLLLLRANLVTIGFEGVRIRLIEVYKLGLPFLMMRVNNWLLTVAGIWILGMYHSLEEVALYGAANIVALLVVAPQMLMNGVGAPVIVELFHQNRMVALENIVRAAAFFALLPSLLLTIILGLFGDVVLMWIYGQEYQQAALILIILAVGRCVAVSCGVPAITLAMTDHHNLVLKVTTSMSVVTFAGYFMFVEQTGAIGIASVTAASIAAQNLVLVYLVKRNLDVVSFPAMSLTVWQRFLSELLKRKRSV